ncbi:ABC transporter substrate-binding protein [Naasia sp. SYSU D00948]|uniref:ABC transporter substrate-binding protein n=1 Tax=Naasia sp. SYSU D00948 TaxID=2817379 RepID=UPI001B30BFED|nr:ABC transporter substrate-binding protein [Naasia sp. SYSU D00948]
MFRLKRAAAVALAATLALAGCAAGGGETGGGDGSGGGDGGGGTLTWGVIAPASTFAQKDMRWANESPYGQAVYDSLLRANPDFEVEPNLATEWEYNEDNTVLTLTLRDDVTFTNGETLTAEDAAASLLAFKGGASPNATLLRNLADARAIDETTLELTLGAPDPGMLSNLTQNAGLVAPAELVDDPAMATEPVGSGPYILNTGETVVGSSYVFDKNEDYWKPEDQHYDKLVLQVYTDPTALLNAVQGGQLNVTNVVDKTTVPQMEAAGYTLNRSELDWSGFLIMDRAGTLVPALGDVRVRQAINFALDREALLATMGAGFGEPTTQIFAPWSPSFDEELDEFYEYDVDRAKELLAEAGYEDGFEVTMPQTPSVAASTWTLMADQLAQIGITVNYEQVQATEFIPGILAAKYPMTWFQLQMGPTDWQLSQFQIAEQATWNPLRYTTPEVEEWIATIQTGTEDEAAEAGQELNRYLVENAWNAPFFRPTVTFMSDANTEAVPQTGNAVPYLWNVQPK